MSVQNSVRSYLGIAKEVTRGTPVAPTAFIPVAQGKIKPQDIVGPLLDEGLRGSIVKDYNYVQGRKHSTFEFGGPVFPDTFPWAVAGLLGSVDTTGASAPYTHVVTIENSSVAAADAQPTAFTLTDFYSAAVRAYAGSMIHDLSLTFNAEGLLEYDAKAMGWPSTTASTPTPVFTTVLPTPVWQAAVTIAGSTVSNSVQGNLNMSRPATPIFGLATTQSPYSIFLGALEVKGQLRFVMEDDTQLTNFLTNTQPAITIDWSNGAGSTATQVKAQITKGAYTVAQIDRSKDFVEVVIDFTGISNTTDAGSTSGFSPIKWTFKNAIASGTYQ